MIALMLAKLEYLGRRAMVVSLDGCMADIHTVVADGRISKVEMRDVYGASKPYLFATVEGQSRPLDEFRPSERYGCLVAFI